MAWLNSRGSGLIVLCGRSQAAQASATRIQGLGSYMKPPDCTGISRLDHLRRPVALAMPALCSDQVCDRVVGLALRLFPIMLQDQQHRLQHQQQAAQRDTTDAVAHCLQACDSHLELPRQSTQFGSWQPRPQVYLTLLAMLLQCTKSQLYTIDSVLQPMMLQLCSLSSIFNCCTFHLQPQCREAEKLTCRTLYAAARHLLKGPPDAATPAAVTEYGAGRTAAAAWAAHSVLDGICGVHIASEHFKQLWPVSDWHVLTLNAAPACSPTLPCSGSCRRLPRSFMPWPPAQVHGRLVQQQCGKSAEHDLRARSFESLRWHAGSS